MPWKSVSIMESRREFVRLAEQGDVTMAELCRRFGISRQTGYEYLRRHREGGDVGLEDRSRRPLSSPRRSAEAMEARIVELRAAHPRWGGRKLARRLKDLGVADVPAASTVTAVLRRHEKLDAAEASKHRAFERFERAEPNDLWQMDFKGHFAIGHGRCHPLTVLDDHSRYVVGLIACTDETRLTVQTHVTQLFRRYGLPRALLTDNGSPWGTCGAGGHTGFEVWLMRLGICLLHGRPYHPQTQGKDERLNRTVDVEVLQARRFDDIADCQGAFDEWRPIYNEQRPHEALSLSVPASRYRPSVVAFPERLAVPEYGATDLVRRVGPDGTTAFKTHKVKLSQAFAGLDVAFRPTTTDGVWKFFFMRFGLAEVDLRQTEAHITPVRDVPEHLSSMSPV
jgi:transposase InsO family protein